MYRSLARTRDTIEKEREGERDCEAQQHCRYYETYTPVDRFDVIEGLQEFFFFF